MEYSNPQPSEGINSTRTHPLKEFLLLSGGLLAIASGVLLLAWLFAEQIAEYIPIESEARVARAVIDESPLSKDGVQVQAYLQQLTERLAIADGYSYPVTAHYSEEPVMNAYATLGAHILIYRGLLQNVKSENELATVIAHEIGHIKFRHPIKSMSRGIIVAIALSAIGIGIESGMTSDLVGRAGMLTQMKFSREQEKLADETGLVMVKRLYGHLAGANSFFERIGEMRSGDMVPTPPEFLSTHPAAGSRISAIQHYAEVSGTPLQGALTEIPNEIITLLKATRESR